MYVARGRRKAGKLHIALGRFRTRIQVYADMAAPEDTVRTHSKPRGMMRESSMETGEGKLVMSTKDNTKQ